MNAIIGKGERRIDGRDKVTGHARYAADFHQPRQAYAVIVGATVGLGRIKGIDAEPVLKLPGVIAVISHLNAPRLPYGGHKSMIDPGEGERLHVLQDDRVYFYGQPVAVVVADTLDQAERAAMALRVEYDAARPLLDPGDPQLKKIAPRENAEQSRGDPDAVLPKDAVGMEADYVIARENHTPIELHATLAAWDGDQLTLWSKSQFVVNERAEVAAIFGIPPDNVQVICPFVGGAFGSSLRTWPHVTLAAMAARQVGRPVKLVLTRRQTFHMTGHRPYTMQHVALSATPDGKLLRVVHEATAETSRYEQFTESLTTVASYMYSCPSVRTRYRLLPRDTATPTHMRGPGEASGIYALESAMDELAHALKMDPVELRRRNEPKLDESANRPFSSRSLLQCMELGAERFGWSRRQREPGSMRDGRLQLGWGMAAGTYPVFFAPAGARVRLLADGTFEVETASSDMGPGTYTSMTQVTAETLGVPMEQVRVQLGRSDFPATPPHGGSMTMASVGSGVRAACLALQQQIAKHVAQDSGSPFSGASSDELEWREGRLLRRGRSDDGLAYRDTAGKAGGKPFEATASGSREKGVGEKYSMHAFGAVFVEVAIDPDVKTMSVRRLVGAYGAGRIVNPRLASSQCTGGMIGGIGMALMEGTALDPRDGRPVNAHMADYLMPVNLDIHSIEAHFVDETDPHVNELGVKGVGEIALVGVAPAIANAIFHATGKRMRHLPIKIENLLET